VSPPSQVDRDRHALCRASATAVGAREGNPVGLMRVRQAAKEIGLNPISLWRAIKAGELRAYRPGLEGVRLQVRLADVEAWLETKRVRPEDA